jgi:hypothetical protein
MVKHPAFPRENHKAEQRTDELGDNMTLVILGEGSFYQEKIRPGSLRKPLCLVPSKARHDWFRESDLELILILGAEVSQDPQ